MQINNGQWGSYQTVFDILSDDEIEAKKHDAQLKLDGPEWLDALQWLDAVGSWEKAGRHRKGNI